MEEQGILDQIINLVKACIAFGIFALICWVILGIFKLIVFKVYDHFASDGSKGILHDLIYKYDEFADKMSNDAKRDAVATEYAQSLANKGFKVPKFLIKWVINAEVATIRKLQESDEKNTNLHDPNTCEECKNDPEMTQSQNNDSNKQN